MDSPHEDLDLGRGNDEDDLGNNMGGDDDGAVDLDPNSLIPDDDDEAALSEHDRNTMILPEARANELRNSTAPLEKVGELPPPPDASSVRSHLPSSQPPATPAASAAPAAPAASATPAATAPVSKRAAPPATPVAPVAATPVDAPPHSASTAPSMLLPRGITQDEMTLAIRFIRAAAVNDLLEEVIALLPTIDREMLATIVSIANTQKTQAEYEALLTQTEADRAKALTDIDKSLKAKLLGLNDVGIAEVLGQIAAAATTYATLTAEKQQADDRNSKLRSDLSKVKDANTQVETRLKEIEELGNNLAQGIPGAQNETIRKHVEKGLEAGEKRLQAGRKRQNIMFVILVLLVVVMGWGALAMLIAATNHVDTDAQTSHATTTSPKVMAGPTSAPPLPVSTDDGIMMSIKPGLLNPDVAGKQRINIPFSDGENHPYLCITPCPEKSLEGLPRCKCSPAPAQTSTP